VLPTKSGAVVGEGVATIVGGAGWHETPPATWLVDAMAAPARVAQQLAQAVGETLVIAPGALRPGRAAFARAEQPASQTLISLLAEGALWWVGFDGVTQAAPDRPSPTLSADLVLEHRADERSARLDVEEPSQAPIGGQIPGAGERFSGPQRIRSLDMMADEEGVEAWVSFALPESTAPRLASLVEAVGRPSGPAPHATWRAATVQSQDAQRRASLRLEERDKELGDPLPVPSWCGVPGVSAEVFSGTRTLLAFDRADATNPLSALWSPYGQTGHVPKRVFHEAHEEIRLLGASSPAAKVLVGLDVPAPPAPVALAPQIDLVLAQVVVGFTAVATYASAVTAVSPATLPAATALVSALSPILTAIAALSAPYPAGYRSTKLEAQ
jgi:hypothetical protein